MRRQEVRVSLCGGEKCCPEVVVEASARQVRIGEAGNLVVLDRRAWNTLVEKIRTQKLRKL